MNWIIAYAPLAAIASGITAGLITVLQRGKTRVLLLLLQYFCVAWLISLALEMRIALIKLVAGMIVCGVFAVTETEIGRSPRAFEREEQTGLFFRMIAALLVSTGALGLGRASVFQLPAISGVGIASSMILVGLGLLQLGLARQPIAIGFGLLTLISGFEIVYSALEPSIAMVGLLAIVHIGIALSLSIVALDIDLRCKDEGATN